MLIFNQGTDPGFLDREFKFTKGVDLLIIPDFLLLYLIFSENSMKMEKKLSQRGVPVGSLEPPEPPLDWPLI